MVVVVVVSWGGRQAYVTPLILEVSPSLVTWKASGWRSNSVARRVQNLSGECWVEDPAVHTHRINQ